MQANGLTRELPLLSGSGVRECKTLTAQDMKMDVQGCFWDESARGSAE